MMVKKGHSEVLEVRYEPPGGDAGGIEVMSFGQLHRRLRRRPGMEMAQRLDFHQLLTVQQGMVRHMVDFTDYMATPGAWLWVRPGQVQQFHDLTSGSGWLVLFQSGVLDAATSAQTGLDDLFGRVHWELAGDDAAAMEEALGHLVHEYESTASLPAALRARILQHLLAVVMLRLTYQTTQVGSPTADHPEAFVRFRSAVEERFARARNVNDYARALGYSPARSAAPPRLPPVWAPRSSSTAVSCWRPNGSWPTRRTRSVESPTGSVSTMPATSSSTSPSGPVSPPPRFATASARADALTRQEHISPGGSAENT